ncbi:hypothetical protein BX600DRAFT_432207 [Xylariales sp. PMI_506]|nr:hypothetical protein BX600DRAFT_432207 [Xylariales sp. PMI_506]
MSDITVHLTEMKTTGTPMVVDDHLENPSSKTVIEIVQNPTERQVEQIGGSQPDSNTNIEAVADLGDNSSVGTVNTGDPTPVVFTSITGSEPILAPQPFRRLSMLSGLDGDAFAEPLSNGTHHLEPTDHQVVGGQLHMKDEDALTFDSEDTIAFPMAGGANFPGRNSEFEVSIGGGPGPDIGNWQRRSEEERVAAAYRARHAVATRSRQDRPPFTSKPPTLQGMTHPVTNWRLALNPRCTSTRNLQGPIQLDNRPILVVNALDEIVYNGTCCHCTANICPCNKPSYNGHSYHKAGVSEGGSRGGTRIKTEGFCRHCVLNRCACIVDVKWGQCHAKNAMNDYNNPRAQQSVFCPALPGSGPSPADDAAVAAAILDGSEIPASAGEYEMTQRPADATVAPAMGRRISGEGDRDDADAGAVCAGDVEAQQRQRGPGRSRRLLLTLHRYNSDLRAAYARYNICYGYVMVTVMVVLIVTVIFIFFYVKNQDPSS